MASSISPTIFKDGPQKPNSFLDFGIVKEGSGIGVLIPASPLLGWTPSGYPRLQVSTKGSNLKSNMEFGVLSILTYKKVLFS